MGTLPATEHTEPVVLAAGGRAHSGPSALLGTPQVPHLGLPSQGSVRKPSRLGSWRSERNKGEWNCNTNTHILAGHVPPGNCAWTRDHSQQLCPSPEQRLWPYLPQELRRQFCLVWFTRQQTMQALDLVLWHCPEKKANLKPHLFVEFSLQSCPTKKPNQPLQPWSSSYSRETSQQSCPATAFSCWLHIKET